MSYLALYRRYRPKTFDEVIGQDGVIRTLVNQIENKRPGHAYLFTGTRGTGKTSTAKIFAKAVNCLNPKNGSPCGECQACKALADPSNIDVLEIDAASNNGVNEIRELRDNAQFPPVTVRYKVYIIDEVHMLTGAAFNALLKTLEEPPEHAIFILATTEAHKLPATILSRCMRFDFKLVPTEKIAELIEKIYDEQGKEYEKEAVFAIARAGAGSIRDALSIADTAISYGDGKLTYSQVTEILGATDEKTVYRFVSDMLKGESGNALTALENLCNAGKSVGVLAKDLVSVLRDLLIVKTCKTADKLLGIPQTALVSLKEITEGVSEERLLRAMEILAEAENSLKYSSEPRVILETAVVKAARPESDYDIGALLARVKALEDKLQGGVINFSAPVTVNKNTGNVPENKAETGAPAPQSNEKTETVAEVLQKPAEKTEKAEKAEKIPLSTLTDETLKGRVLSNLRKLGSEMLWNAMQGVGISIRGDDISIVPSSQEDFTLLNIEQNKAKIKESLSEVDYYGLTIKEPTTEKIRSEIDDATERLKKLFGEDVVIVKK